MTRYLLSRLGQSIVVFLIVSVVVFFAVRTVPQDPIYALVGEDAEGYTPAQIETIREEFGLNRPLPVQYMSWVGDALKGDWGLSFQNKLPVIDLIKKRIPFTLTLAVGAMAISIVFGISTGVIAALTRNSKWDMMATGSAMFAVAVPEFWLALMMILFFGVTLGILPVYGAVLIWDDPIEGFRLLIMPAFALGIGGAATLMRQSRSSMLETMGEDYIRTARSKGVKEKTVIIVHALRNSLLPVVTILGLRIGRVLGGAVVIETMFSWPGLGQLAVSSLQKADYPVIMAIVMFSSAAVIIANFVTDIAYSYIDPRIRYA
ncbi:MAG: ABC transporter permease [Chloroflexi bacterium]|nr:ABC transporter permease [Chloroflexota bacterium]